MYFFINIVLNSTVYSVDEVNIMFETKCYWQWCVYSGYWTQ